MSVAEPPTSSSHKVPALTTSTDTIAITSSGINTFQPRPPQDFPSSTSDPASTSRITSSSGASSPPLAARDQQRTRRHVRHGPQKFVKSLEEELAELNASIEGWKRQQLADLSENREVDKTNHHHNNNDADGVVDAAHAAAEAAMEARLQQRREAERTRALQRLDRLLDAVETRLAQSERDAKEAEVVPPSMPERSAGVRDAVSFASAKKPFVTTTTRVEDEPSPVTRVLTACERSYLIGRQQLCLEEHDARTAIVQFRDFGVAAADLYTDEMELRASLMAWQESWYARLVTITQLSKQAVAEK